MAAAWSSYSDIVSEIENQLCDLNGANDEERAKHDRARGPSHVMKAIMTQVGKDRHKTNAA